MKDNSFEKGSTTGLSEKKRIAAFKARFKEALLEVRAIQRGKKQGQTLSEFLDEL